MSGSRVLRQFRGALSPASIADGMNAAAANALRLVEDAELLLANDRLPTAVSLAILAIEETGKLGVLRQLSVALDEKVIKSVWKDYRTHTVKNAIGGVTEMVTSGATRLIDFRPLFDRNSEHSSVLDALKQIGFYTDCVGDAHWAEPTAAVDKKLAEAIVQSARTLVPRSPTTAREIELWVEHLGPVWNTPEMFSAAVAYYSAMRSEGLDCHDPAEMEAFFSIN